MDSLSKLNMILEKIEDRYTDYDVKIIDQWFALRCWANDLLTLDKNIQETSLNPKHKLERIQKAIDQIKPI